MDEGQGQAVYCPSIASRKCVTMVVLGSDCQVAACWNKPLMVCRAGAFTVEAVALRVLGPLVHMG